MDLVDLLDNYLDEEELMPARRRRRTVRPRPDFLNTFDDTDFRARFRLTKNSVMLVHDLIKDNISTNTQRNNAVSTMGRLLLTLRFLATGSFLMTVGDLSGVSMSTACQIIKTVTHAIAQLRPRFIKFPTDLGELRHNFYQIARFPRIVGAIDCTHVDIISPGGENAEYYRNGTRKLHSINVQAICDRRLFIMDLVARWPGSCHDQTVFNNSRIKQRLENGEFGDGIILGDSGYENKSYLFTPYLHPNSPGQNLYNEAQIRTRNVVERCFGVLKNRFPVLRKKITLSLVRTQPLIVACAVLHNIAIEAQEEDFGVHEEVLTPAEIQAREERARHNVLLARHADPRGHVVRDVFERYLQEQLP